MNGTNNKGSVTLAFWLVITMLGILFLIIVPLLVIPLVSTVDDKILEYYKWALSVLVGAFGAWIGAGAAHFFGKENLAESSRSTEAALQIQKEALTGQAKFGRMKDLTLTAMNTDFIFNLDAKKSDVMDGLKDHVDYWFVPVLDAAGNGTLQDVIHSRVFWEPTIADASPLSKIMGDLDTLPALSQLKKLHGNSFYVTATLDDKLSRVSDDLAKSGAVVGIVVDDKGKPTHCFTRIDLQNILNTQK